MYPPAMAEAEASTNINKLGSSKTVRAGKLGAKIYTEVRYWANTITRIL